MVEAQEFLTDANSGQVPAQAVQTSSNIATPECVWNTSTNPVEQRLSITKVICCVGIQMEV